MNRVRRVLHNKIDRKKWDEIVQNSIVEMPYAFSWWLDIVSPGWNALVLSDYQYIFPLPEKTKYTCRWMLQPIFTQQLGVLGINNPDQRIVDKFFKKIKNRHCLLDYHLNFTNTSPLNWKCTERINYTLDLSSTYPELASHFETNHQRNLRQVQNFNLVIKSVTINDCVSFLLKNKGKELLNEDDLSKIKQIVEQAANHIEVIPQGVFFEDELLCTVLWFKFKNRIIYLLPSSSSKGKLLKASFFVVNEMIKKHSGTTQRIDFEGSMVEGVARFYRGFGAKADIYWNVKHATFVGKVLKYFKQKTENMKDSGK